MANCEVEDILNEEDIVKLIKAQGMHWYGEACSISRKNIN